MKRAVIFILSMFAVPVICSCQRAPQATVHQQYAAPHTIPLCTMMNEAGYIPSVPDGQFTGYKLQGVRAELPQEHGAFTQLSTYPLTHSVWMSPELMERSGRRQVRIELGRQRGYYLVDGEVAMDFPVCTGRGKKKTPTGTFSIKQKHIDHHSNLYDCPMPYFMRLTWGGIGMHVGDVYRSPASHGCIRLPRVACEPLYRALSCGSKVQIVD